VRAASLRRRTVTPGDRNEAFDYGRPRLPDREIIQ
jgi:hypothetical protein